VTSPEDVRKLTVPVSIGVDHIRGSVNAPITIVEYGDFECPYTGMAYPVIKELLRQFNEKYTLYIVTFFLMVYILMLNMQQKQPKPQQLKTNSGKFMTIYLNIRKH
jgi:hypothetical protein